ncbi:MAG TPA: glycosyltransferase family 4 protein [Salinivirgaceae bacterium]|nr:glycosyltransferase family 4 protein [Salinivirgaceae bacterium]HQA75639.1 glycosyltransferase family 4 protein [Salinivirgaceae bacterium]
MCKVLRIINRFNLGGPTYNAGYLTKYLPENFETKLIGGPNEKSEADSLFILESIGVKGEVIEEMRRSINPINDLRALRKILKIIKEYKPDIVHTHASKAGTLGRLAAWFSGVPVIVHTYHGHVFHSYFSVFKTFIFKTIERFLAIKSNAIVVISQLQKEELCNKFKIIPEDKTYIIPLGFDLSRFSINQVEKRVAFRSRYEILDNEILVVIVGRLAPVKNHDMFLKMVKNIKDKNYAINFRFMIVGDGETRKRLEHTALTMGLSISTPEDHTENSDIIFTSWIREVENVYAAADISVLTSLNEGTPVSLIESLAAGVPVVSTNVGGIADFITDGVHGFLTNIDQVDLFAQRVAELACNVEKRKQMAENGREKVLKLFDLKRLVTDVTNLYTNLLSKQIKK